MIRSALLVSVIVLTMAPSISAAPYHVILCGSGGEEEYREKFSQWSHRLRTVLVTGMGVSQDSVYLLDEGEEVGESSYANISLASIEHLFDSLAPKLGPEDTLFVYLIGHGSYVKKQSKFHIPGPDLHAADLNGFLNATNAGTIFVLNSTSTSAAFINVISEENHIVCSATKSIDEINATEFMGHFVTALEEGSADLDHDGRISVLEACQQASEMTAAWYTTEGLIATEHAILDDNGDMLGSRLPITALSDALFDDADDPGPSGIFDGKLAQRVFIKDFSFPPNVPQEAIDEYLSAIDAVEVLKQQKATKETDAYYEELEPLLIRAARTNQTIQAHMAEPEVGTVH